MQNHTLELITYSQCWVFFLKKVLLRFDWGYSIVAFNKNYWPRYLQQASIILLVDSLDMEVAIDVTDNTDIFCFVILIPLPPQTFPFLIPSCLYEKNSQIKKNGWLKEMFEQSCAVRQVSLFVWQYFFYRSVHPILDILSNV